MPAKDFFIPEAGDINIPDGGERDYLIPGYGFINGDIVIEPEALNIIIIE